MARQRSNSRRSQQLLLPIDYVRNRGLFSNHWFEKRLEREPEWAELHDRSYEALNQLSDLWTREKDRVQRYGTEAGLEQAFIQPALEILDWKLIYQTFLQGRRPDYALFTDDAAMDASLNADRRGPEFWNHPTIVADAKAWHVPLNRPSIVNNQREYPPQQIEWYLDRSHLDFGILTNGGQWRLVPREYDSHQRRFQTYLECDLAALLDNWQASQHSITERDSIANEFRQFFLFFSRHAYVTELPKPLITRAIEGSTEYRIGVGEGLKERAFEALRLCIEGLIQYAPNDLTAERHLQKCRDDSFILMFRILFIMHAEDRRLLPYRINRAYTDNRSLGRHRDEIGGALDRFHSGDGDDFSDESTEIWDDLQSLFDLVDGGHARYGVPEYNGGLFDSDEDSLLISKRISDWHLARVLDQLGRAPDPTRAGEGLFRVDYRDLAIQHLGGIYEGLLELQPAHALTEVVVISRRNQGRLEEKYITAAAQVPQGWQLTEKRIPAGNIYLKTNKDERRASGSYYTPDHIVNHIVEETVGSLCHAVSDQLEREIALEEQRLADLPQDRAEAERAHLVSLQQDYDDRILRLRILDPAMGSGHFLLRVCQRLAEEIATHRYTGDEGGIGIHEGESAVSFWKRRVVEHCLYGVDLNPLAVELAKLALWLETVAGDEPLSFLDHHLRQGNSLVGGRIEAMGGLPGEIELLSDNFTDQIQSKMADLLQPLKTISELDSDSAVHVKEKERLYADFEKAREPFRLVSDLWCSAYCPDNTVTSQHFQEALDELGRPVRFARLTAQDWFRTAIEQVRTHFLRCFHWELEFPEVFFEGDRLRAEAGFDAVIGNPPYEVLSDLESGMDLTALRAVIEGEEVYAPSRIGKNNLYKLFICRGLELVRIGGYFGFITPMAVLGDKITANIRHKIMSVASFTGIDAFPQKDRPAKRVFPEAKLSTAVFTLHRQTERQPEFRVRRHAGRLLENDSPSYSLSTADIPLYDPVNHTIVTGEQADWDLVTRFFQIGRMVRLSEFTEFFQGEVNETNERAQGNLTTADRGALVTRGASICLYVTRPASQGRDLFLNVDRFLNGKDEETKAFHFRHRRVCWQESSPQNNFRRIIAALVPVGQFCNHKINYLPEHTSRLPLEFVLGLLNSKLMDWYFRLGSSNAAVSHYQIYNLPCPVFDDCAPDGRQVERVRRLIRAGAVDHAYELIAAELAEAPFNSIITEAIVQAVNSIIDVENGRGDIRRVDRSALDPEAQPYQDFVDRLLFAMAGLSADDARGLEERYSRML